MSAIVSAYRQLFTRSRNWLLAAVVIFFIFAGVGVVIGHFYPSYMEDISKGFSEEFGEDPALDIHFAQDIFIQNLTVSAVALLGGVFFGIAPFLILAANGFLLGYVLAATVQLVNAPYVAKVIVIFLGIAPHGIIEIPTFLLAGALGLQLGLRYLRRQHAGNRLSIFKSDLKLALLSGPLIIVMLVIAALIEVFVTGNILSLG